MVTDPYTHILDDSRVENAQLIEDAFYADRGAGAPAESEKPAQGSAAAEALKTSGIDEATLSKILKNPDMVKLLKTLATTL